MAVSMMVEKEKADRIITVYGEEVPLADTYAGCVITTYEENGYDDSDFYATVWDDEKQAVVNVMYATTRGWTYGNSAKIDITPENLVKAQMWNIKEWERIIRMKAEQASKEVKVGRTVRVIKGRKIEIGTEAKVTWVGETRYGKRVGLEINSKTEFIDLGNVEVVDPGQYLPTDEQVLQSAWRNMNNWSHKHPLFWVGIVSDYNY